MLGVASHGIITTFDTCGPGRDDQAGPGASVIWYAARKSPNEIAMCLRESPASARVWRRVAA